MDRRAHHDPEARWAADLPAGETAPELEAFREDLVKQLRRLALPGRGA